jgi:hypothetical protein
MSNLGSYKKDLLEALVRPGERMEADLTFRCLKDQRKLKKQS